MILLVCGDRSWNNRNIMEEVITQLAPKKIIEGECKGADKMSRSIGEALKIPVRKFTADWLGAGPSAGPIRNAKMLREGQPDLVVAFHASIETSKGTVDMLTKAEDAGVPYFLIEGNFYCCLFCRSFDVSKPIQKTVTCSKEIEVTDSRNQVCEDWRYSN